ncbi:MAG: response regulator [Rhodospirillales bacterium]
MAERIKIDTVNFLVIDRNQLMRELLVGILRAFGARDIRTAATYPDAKEAIGAKPPEIMFTSWKLDPTNGVDLTREIRWSDKEAVRFIPIIMVSGHGEEKKVLRAREAGINEFVVKPYAAATILSRMHAVIMKPRRYVKTETFFGPDRRRTTAFEYSGDERRSDDDTAHVVAKPQRKTPEMSQDEINDLMNPDDIEAPPEADGAHFEDQENAEQRPGSKKQDA